VTRVLLVATTTGYQIRSFGEAASALGITLVFASDRCDRLDDPWWDQAIPVRFHEHARSVGAVLQATRDAPIDGVVAVGDRPAVLAAYVARALGLPWHPPEAAALGRNKLATRQALERAGLPTPRFVSLPVDAPVEQAGRRVHFPAVVKPVALSGSRGVIRVDTSDELRAAFERLRRVLRSRDIRLERDAAHGQALVESFIPGVEYAVEGVLDRGTLQVLALIDKPDPLDGPFFEETIYRMPSTASADTQRRIVTTMASACHAIGLRHGPIHAECRVNGEQVYVLEVAARPIGGLCSRALRFGPARTSLEEVVLRHAVGEDVTRYVREADASGVMMIPIPRRGIYRRAEGVDEAKTVAGVEDVRITAKPDTLLLPLPEARSYLGFIFARGRSPDDVDRSLRQAHARLRFVIDREMAVVG
jgi:biotin carboxylase